MGRLLDEDDVVSRQAVYTVIEEVLYETTKGADNWYGLLNDGVRTLPSAQQEIIYCKECSRYSNGYCHHPETYGMYVDANHFCGYAERMGNERSD